MWNNNSWGLEAQNSSGNASDDGLHPEYNWEVLGLLPIMLFGTTGNILVCMAVSMEKRLQSVTNYFLLSLAITDLLVSIIVMPFSMIHQFFGYWPFDYILCDLYVTSDVLMCTSSILHLCTISLERYLAISSPLSVRNKSKGIVILKIVLVWASSLAITSPITILGFMDETNVIIDQQCALTNAHFIIYGSVCAFFIPLGIMVITYFLTVRLLRQKSNMCGYGMDNEGMPMIRRSISRKAKKFRQRVQFEPRRTKSCPSKRHDNYAVSSPERTASVNLKSALSEFSTMELSPPPSPLYSTGSTDLDTITEESHNGLNGWRKSSLTSTSCSMSSNDSPKRLQNLIKKHQLVVKATGILLLRKDSEKQRHPHSPARYDQDDVNTEQKASKVLGVVFAIFVICWAPFFIVNIMTVLCKECVFSPLLINAVLWLGYVSSTLNPIIYTMFNKTFKMTFIKLLKCQYRNIQKSLRIRWNSRNGYQSTFRTSSYYAPEDRAEASL